MPIKPLTAAGRKNPIRSAFFAATFALAAILSGPSMALAEDQNWVGTWMASPQPIWDADFAFPTKIPASVEDQTIRQVVRISLGGSRVRLVLSNAYGDRPMRIGGASVGSLAKAVRPSLARSARSPLAARMTSLCRPALRP